MIHSMNILMGSFYNVVGVAMGNNCVTILGDDGTETLLPVYPNFAPGPLPIAVTGEFGDYQEAKAGHTLQGIRCMDITHVDILGTDDPTDDLHLRHLRVTNSSGLTLTWELFCNGFKNELKG